MSRGALPRGRKHLKDIKGGPTEFKKRVAITSIGAAELQDTLCDLGELLTEEESDTSAFCSYIPQSVSP